jgi:DNA-binding transcriptional MerR regulator
MSEHNIKVQLPPIPAKRYFTIGEVSELCGVKPHVLRYWEQEFTQLKPVKRRGNRRYYQHHEVLLIRRIRELLYEQGFTISGARNRLDGPNEVEIKADNGQSTTQLDLGLSTSTANNTKDFDFSSVKAELLEILNLLRPALST